jgi:hypothetical protein
MIPWGCLALTVWLSCLPCSFIFDFNFGRRVKLHDPLAFPEVLNMGPFVHGASSDGSGDNAGSGANAGDMEYELYSVLVHYGTAMGGHYFAYVKVHPPRAFVSSTLHLILLPTTCFCWWRWCSAAPS